MAISIAYRPIGPTTALSVTASAHTPVVVSPSTQEQGFFIGLLNPSASVSVFVSVLPLVQNTGAAPALTAVTTPVFPVDGTSTSVTNGVVLPPLMEFPFLMPCPFGVNGVAVTAIGSAAGPTIIYVTPFSNIG